MAKSLSSLSRLSRDDLPGAPNWVDPLIQVSNEFQEQATERLNQDLLTGQFAAYDFVHGVEKIIKSPLGAIPAGISPIRCMGLEVDAAGKNTGAFYALGITRLDWREIQTRAGDPVRVGVTVFYAAPSGAISTYLSASTGAIAITGFHIEVPINTVLSSSGNFTFDPLTGRATCLAAGIVTALVTVSWVQAVAGFRYCSVRINSDGVNRYADCTVPSTGSGYPTRASGGADMTVAAGQYISAWGYQDSGGSLQYHGGFGTGCSRLDIHYVAPLPTTTGRVTLRFDGVQ